ncbi:MAG: hypothetical protein NZO16_04640, partial [Deltaproteobacteria bacterium]|nr:hypothetical protein [Deltaproteobacteria bacterium]
IILERRLFFEDLGQNVTLIPHLLANEQDSLATAIELQKKNIGGQIFMLVDPLDKFVIDLCASLGISTKPYTVDLSFANEDEDFIRFIKQAIDAFPIAAVLLSTDFKVIHVNKVFSLYISLESAVSKVGILLQNSISQFDLNSPAKEFEFLNFSGFGVLRRVTGLNKSFFLFLAVENSGANDCLAYLEPLLNLTLWAIDKSLITAGDYKGIYSTSGVINVALHHLDKILPRTVEVAVNDPYNHPIYQDALQIAEGVALIMLKLAVIIGNSGKIELEIFPTIDNGRILLYFTATRAFMRSPSFLDLPFLKVSSDYLEKILSAIDSKLNYLSQASKFNVEFNIQYQRSTAGLSFVQG